jgi:hypothetical protein
MKLKQLSLLNRRGVDQGYSLFMLLMLTGLMIFLIVGCDHNITSSGFVVFSRAKQPPTGFYTGMRNHEKTGKDAKPEPYPALTGLEVAANSERWVINITPAKDGLMRVELGMTAQMTAAKAQPARTHTICRLSRFSERVSISHIMDWQSLEYYQFSAALWDPVMTRGAGLGVGKNSPWTNQPGRPLAALKDGSWASAWPRSTGINSAKMAGP